jgi:hypothetical protein
LEETLLESGKVRERVKILLVLVFHNLLGVGEEISFGLKFKADFYKK